MTPLLIPALSDDESRLANGLLTQLDEKLPRNLLRASYYDGKRAMRQVTQVLPPNYFRLGIVLGWSAKAVDTLARRCNLDGFVWADGDLDVLGLDEVLENNAFATASNAALVSKLIHGVAFAINTEGDDDEPRALIHFKDAMNATGEWNGRRHRLENLLSVNEWDAEGNPKAFALYLDGETIVAERDSSGWSVDRKQHKWGVPAEALVYKPRIGRPFGSSRISRPVMSMHDAALRTVIRLEAHGDVYSWPDLMLLGADETVFKNADGSPRGVWQTMLGRIKGIPDDDDAANPRAQVQQIAAASPQPHLEILKQQAMLFSGETSIPLSSLGVSDMSNPTSADSYIASREDLIAEAEGATDDDSLPIRRLIARALAMQTGEANGIPEAFKTIQTKWRSPMYLSRSAQADAGMKQLAAVSWLAETEVGLELVGLSPEQRREALSEKRRLAGSGVLQKLTAAAAARAPQQTETGADDVATDEQPEASAP